MQTRGLAYAIEQRALGGRHPHLAAAFEAGEQCRAALRVEVGGDLVEEQDRRLAAAPRRYSSSTRLQPTSIPCAAPPCSSVWQAAARYG